ncbi:MAG: hypothetical protein HY015_06000 [Bacteroidetes bacterium]|nr:hypothetical protein [Bacteroidota bacterium]MBI3482515.1 hypothetical protein [Bacteroidota bacterium]
MSVKVIIWIIIGIIYLISRARKKPDSPSSRPESRPAETETFDKPVSFEDLLKEIQAAKSPKPIPAPSKTDYVNYDEDIEEREKPLEKTDYNYRDHDTIYETYEKAKQEAFHRPSMEETLKLENTIVRFGQFKNYAQDDRPGLAAEYAKDLQDPVNFKKAFILSEILNRRF